MTKDSRPAIPETGGPSPVRSEGRRKPYSRPLLESLGDIRITQAGTSPGAFDSQFPNTRP